MHLLKETHPTKELQDFIKQLIETKSKEEEDKIIRHHLEDLKILTAQKSLSNAKMIEYCIKAIYSEMLGHDASFSHVFAIKMIENKSIFVKKVGYLASSLMLDSESDLKILLVATLQRDLASKNELEIISSLNALNKLINVSFAPVFAQLVSTLADHKNPIIKKKALISMQKIEQLAPNSIPLYVDKVKKALVDKDPSVINASLNIIIEDCVKNKELFVPLLIPLCNILSQITQKKLGYYDYQKIPEPYMQIKILKILSILAKNDKKHSAEVNPVIEKVLNRADNLNTDVSYAVVFECVLTICSIYYDKALVKAASNAIAKFLNPALNNSNMIYMGINALKHISEVEPSCVQDHQMFVVNCLESTDDTIKRITLDLLCKNTKSSNLETITSKLLKSLVTTNDQSFKTELTRQVFDLTVRYSTDFKWFIEKMIILLKNSSDNFNEAMVTSTIKILDENFRDDSSVGRFIIDSFFKFFEESSLPDVTIKLISWVIGNIGLRINSSAADLHQSFQALQALYNFKMVTEETRIWILDALFNLSRSPGFERFQELIQVIDQHQNSPISEIRLKIFEIKNLSNAFPNFEYLPVSFDSELPFLLAFMNSKKGKFYNADVSERICGAQTHSKQPSVGLKLTHEERAFDSHHQEKAIVDGTEEILLSSNVNSKWTLSGYQKDTKEPKTANISTTQKSTNLFSNMETKKPKNPDANQEDDMFAGLNINRNKKNQKMADNLFGGANAEFDMFANMQKTSAQNPNNSTPAKSQPSQGKNELADDFDDLLGLGTGQGVPQHNQTQTHNSTSQISDDNFDFLMGETSKAPQPPQKDSTVVRPYKISENDYEQHWENLKFEKEGVVNGHSNLESLIRSLGFQLISQIEDDYISAAISDSNAIVLLYLKKISNSSAEFIVKSNHSQLVNELAKKMK
jgi:AP-4 complex subunit epsilon-1